MQPIRVIEEQEFEAATTADVVAAVDRLNGKDRNLVVFDRGDRSLTIGGGSDGRYVANVAIGIDEAFFSLVDPAKPADVTVNLVVGGQLSAVPARHVVDRRSVVTAALYFAENGDRSPDLSWEEQT